MKRRRVLGLAGSAAMAFVAGCQGGTAGDVDREGSMSSRSTSDSPTATTTQSTTEEVTEFDLPPGFTRDGVVDAETVAEGHLAALDGTTYTVDFHQWFWHPDTEYVQRFDRSRTVGLIENTRTGEQRYVDGRTVFVNDPSAADPYSVTTVDEAAARRLFLGTVEYGVFDQFDSYQYTEPEFRTLDGRPVATFHINGRMKGSLTVSPEGLIESVRVTRYTENQVEYAVSGVGTTTVERPAWVGDA